MDKIKAAVEWLNAVPGRKRGIAALLLAAAAGARALGKTQLAEVATGLNDVVQTYLVPGGDILGGVMAIWGLVGAKKL